MAKPTDKLREYLTGLENILSRAQLYGGNEIAKARDLQARIKRILSPEPVEPLAAEAAAFVRTFLPAIEANRQHAQAHEAGQERASAEHKARYEAHHAKQAAAIEQRHKQQEAARMAVAEVIG